MADVSNAPGTQPLAPGKAGLGVTQRQDPWWAEWVGVAAGLGLLFGYRGAGGEYTCGKQGQEDVSCHIVIWFSAAILRLFPHLFCHGFITKNHLGFFYPS